MSLLNFCFALFPLLNANLGLSPGLGLELIRSFTPVLMSLLNFCFAPFPLLGDNLPAGNLGFDSTGALTSMDISSSTLKSSGYSSYNSSDSYSSKDSSSNLFGLDGLLGRLCFLGL